MDNTFCHRATGFAGAAAGRKSKGKQANERQ